MISYTIHPSKKLVRAHMQGTNTFTDVVEFLDRVLGDETYEPHFNCLFVVAPMAHAEVMHHQEAFKNIIEQLVASHGNVKWAVVMPNKLQTLFAQLIMEWVNLDPVEMKYFPDEDAALAWLSNPPDSQADIPD